jgi:subtilisin-like proprotein convertase family protein
MLLNRFHFIAGLLAAFAFEAQGQSFNFTVNTAIPDGEATGLVNAQTISSAPGQTIVDLNVSLTITGTGLGGFNGDLYVSLEHESGFSVLLNRAGKQTGTPQGYSDSGFNVVFDESATRDIHNYRFELNGNHTTPVSGPVTGTWQSDRRSADPAAVLNTSSRDASLDSFANVPVNGQWVLFVSDLSSGGTQTLNSWGMQITAVPEPREVAAAGGALLLLFAAWRRFFPADQKLSATG